MNDEGNRSVWAWSAAAAAAVLANASGAGWLACGILAGILLPLGAWGQDGWGKMGKAMALVQVLWMTVMLGLLLPDAAGYWPSPNAYIVPLSLLLLAMLPAQSKQNARTGAVLLVSMLVLFVPVALSGAAAVEIRYLNPQWNYWSMALVPAMLLPALGGCLERQSGGSRRRVLLGIGIFAVAAGIVTQGILGESLCRQEVVPFHTAAQTMRLGGLSRFEAIVSMGMTLGYYAVGSYLISCVKAMARTAGIPEKASVWMAGAGAALVGVMPSPDPWIAAVGCGILWGVVPILYGKKKSKKGEKSA